MSDVETRSAVATAVRPAPSTVINAVNEARSRKSVLVGVHFPQSAIDALDSYIEADFNEMKRPEAIRQIVKRWLVEQGHYNKK